MYIFLDYDGTLIKNKEEDFQKYYFYSFLNYTNIKDKKIIDIILECTKELIKKNDRKENNLDFYMNLLAKKTGKSQEYWYNTFFDFYEKEFPNLKNIIIPNKKLINKIKKSNHNFIFASNPVFPEIAINHRINFINLDLNDFIYISTMENSYFCKPNPNYFLDILKKLKIKPADCIMIGDTDFDRASLKVGIDFIHISEEDKWESIL
ncbi:Phosphoglycolate phosphatase, HAD superfamily [Marinitoga hydrogenitolerans DSM 16785]|uniref:Phosphoglycolate phosphatase, HAD superfamily n=1 Tax=Marinitoga hydrogenitolerans (strain DSM 16785 / JCM 12826 / AT1271) TaxID=1122195 RepID=A0A1M4YPI4_MARH1|nr:HAD family hydrolase [Marinitoga hydrogenitolerans]SHF07563.1 Phosphoglycolate phosphatase, HAD superfamily [Marinitoga hydrogenitolerans DSM 16785]